MKSRTGSLLLSVLAVLTAGAVFFWSNARSGASAQTSEKPRTEPDGTDSLTDQPIAAWRLELLDLAFRTASALPIQPHIKNRSRAQEHVVAECLALDQPRRASGYIERIANWRRGAGYADLAYYLAQAGETAAVQAYLDLALEAAEAAEKDDNALESAQDWKKERVLLRIAQTHALLGERSARTAAGAANSASDDVAVADAMHAPAKAFDEELAQIDQIAATGSFDQVRQALEDCAQLFDRFHADAERRSRAEEKIKSSWGKLPIQVRLELLMQLSGFALDHADSRKALELIEEAHVLMGSTRWTPDHQIPLVARLATLRHRAGETQKARTETEGALAMFDEQRERIVNIDRSDVLRALAEAYASMSDGGAAAKLYTRAVEAGVENPNSRPRAEDLSAACCSMARHEIEPDAALLARMIQIHERLGVPW